MAQYAKFRVNTDFIKKIDINYIYYKMNLSLQPTVKNIRPLMEQSGLKANKGHFCGMDYQSTTGISVGTNRRRMRNLLPPAGITGLVPLVINKKIMLKRIVEPCYDYKE